MSNFLDPVVAGINEVRRSWGWFLALGILLTLLGAFCIAADIFATFATVLVFGWFLLIGGVFALVHAFTVRTWSGFFLHLLSALFRGVTGYLLIRYPAPGAMSLTMLLACFFVVSGLFRTIGSATLKLPRWGWSVFSGLVTVALGVLLLTQLVMTSTWFIGFAVGIDMIFEGVSLSSFAIAIRSLPEVHQSQAAAA
jgi:uncharacterized membrane protein HdeD (DUF308 family)